MILLISDHRHYCTQLSLLFKFHYDSINFFSPSALWSHLTQFKFHYDSINFKAARKSRSDLTSFKFHYDSINFRISDQCFNHLCWFKFHYDSINFTTLVENFYFCSYLNSIMILLIWYTWISDSSVPSIFKFHYDSINLRRIDAKY